MNIMLSYDYEIYFNKNDKDSIKTLVDPTSELLQIMNSYNVQSTFFIDAGYLFTLEKYLHIDNIKKEHAAINKQIYEIESWGHEIGFHVHSHWEDTKWENQKWDFNHKRYKLSNFSKKEAHDIFLKYYSYLNSITTSEIKSFRAGGWCLEPFEYIKDAMTECGIIIDSSVFSGGKRKSNTHSYDFSNYPAKEIWFFNDDPSVEINNGNFKEMSISSMYMNRCSYSKLIGMKVIKKISSRGNGQGIAPPISEIARNLFKKSSLPISFDSVKSEFLIKEFRRREINGDAYFSIISHPKMMDNRSMKTLKKFIQYALANGHEFSVISNK